MAGDLTGKVLIIQDLETLRVIADPLRAQIFELLVKENLTVKQVAEKLGLAAGKLYYHINLLEKHGLIRVAETRQVSNMIEKTYRATAAEMDVDPSLLNFTTDHGKENIQALLTSILDSTKEDLLRSVQARAYSLEQGAVPISQKATLKRVISRVPVSRAEEFSERIHALLKDFDESDRSTAAGGVQLQPYALTVAFYPLFFYEKEKGEGNKGEE